MASQKSGILFVLVMLTMFWSGTWAQSSNCNNVLISMSPCLDYITGNSSKPSSGCCSQLANVVKSQPECLCQVISGGGSSLGLKVNQTQALALPGACNVQTPPTTICKGGASSTNSSTNSTDPSKTVPSEKGSKNVPSTGSGTSSGSFTKMTISLLLSLLFIATFASTTTIF